MEQVRTRVSDKGRLVIPAAFREALGIHPGDEVSLRIENDELRISTYRSRVKETQRLVRKIVGPGRTLSAELIAERRQAAKHE